MSCGRKLQVGILTAAVVGLIFCAVPGFAALAEKAPGPEAEKAVEEAPAAVVEEEAPIEETLGPGEEAQPTVEITPAGLISFDFRDAPIQDVLRLFARQVKINIVTTPSVAGTVNMKLENVRWRKALELILEVNKLKMTEDKENNIIKVMTQAEVAAEPMVTTIYDLNYLQAADYELETDGKVKTVPGAATMLKPLLAENETIEADAAGNKLIVHAIPATHDTLDSVIQELDRQIKQVLIEVKFIEASAQADKNLGIKWDFLREYGVEASNLGRDYTRALGRTYSSRSGVSDEGASSESITNSGTNASTAAGSTLLGPTRDYSLETINSFSRDIARDQSQNMSWDRARDVATNVIKTATLSADNVRLVLSALLENSDAKLVSNPRISTVDNKSATIKAVKRWPIPNWTFNAETGTWEVQGFSYEDIGITLNVTPHINEDNFITLDVDPEVSNQAGVTTFGGGAGGTAEIPIIDSRTATTRVIVKSGETLVIGGLVKTDEVLSKSGVPLLKDLPLIGGVLFGHTSKVTRNLDLMIFITPTIVEGPAAGILAPPAK